MIVLNFRHVEVRTTAPQGYIFTIKVSEDVMAGSVGFSLVQVGAYTCTLIL